jgi:hypothetical protein
LLFKIQADVGDVANKFKALDLAAKSAFSGAGEAATTATKAMSLLSATLSGVLLGGITGFVQAIGDATRAVAEWVNELDRVSQATSLNIKLVAELEGAFKEAGGSLHSMIGTFDIFASKLEQAREGNNKLIDLFEKYGIVSKDVTTATDEAFRALGSLTDQTEKTRLAIELFGKGGARQVLQFKDLKDGIQGVTDEYKALGDVLDPRLVKAAQEYEKAQHKLDAQLKVSQAVIASYAMEGWSNLNTNLAKALATLSGILKFDWDALNKRIAESQKLMTVIPAKPPVERGLGGEVVTEAEARAATEAGIAARSLEAARKNKDERTKVAKQGAKDLTDAALEVAKAENALLLIREDAANANKQINDDQAKGLITQEEGARRRIAVLAELQKAEKAVLDARQKAVETDPTLLAKQRAKELNDIETQRLLLVKQAGEAAREENEKTIAADKKLHDAFALHFAKLKLEWIDYAEFIHKTTDEIVQDLARQAQPVPGGGGVGPIPGAPPEIPLPKPPTGVFEDLGEALKNSGAAFTTWSDFASKAISGVAGATEDLLRTFILTGKGGGAAFKALAAGIIASLAVEAAVRAIMEVAYGIADLAKAAAAASNPFTAAQAPGFAAAAALHFHSAAVFGIVAGGAAAIGIGIGAAGGLGGGASQAAGGGGFGGTATETTPSPVNIALGGGATTLAISNAQFQRAQIDAINNLNNKLASMSPGDVVTVAADQKPEAFAAGTLEAGRRNGAFTREFMQISGART